MHHSTPLKRCVKRNINATWNSGAAIVVCFASSFVPSQCLIRTRCLQFAVLFFFLRLFSCTAHFSSGAVTSHTLDARRNCDEFHESYDEIQRTKFIFREHEKSAAVAGSSGWYLAGSIYREQYLLAKFSALPCVGFLRYNGFWICIFLVFDFHLLCVNIYTVRTLAHTHATWRPHDHTECRPSLRVVRRQRIRQLKLDLCKHWVYPFVARMEHNSSDPPSGFHFSLVIIFPRIETLGKYRRCNCCLWFFQFAISLSNSACLFSCRFANQSTQSTHFEEIITVNNGPPPVSRSTKIEPRAVRIWKQLISEIIVVANDAANAASKPSCAAGFYAISIEIQSNALCTLQSRVQ